MGLEHFEGRGNGMPSPLNIISYVFFPISFHQHYCLMARAYLTFTDVLLYAVQKTCVDAKETNKKFTLKNYHISDEIK